MLSVGQSDPRAPAIRHRLAITEDLTAQPDNGDEVYEDVLDTQHELYPDKVIIHTEGTIDSVSAKASCNQQCLKPPCGCEDL